MSDYFTLQIKLYPTPIQKKILAQTVGASRWVYNYFLDKKIKAYEDTGKGLTYFQTANLLPKLKSQHLWLKEVDATSLQQSLKNLDTAYKNFFKHGRGFPKFKKRGIRDSFRVVMNNQLKENQVKIGKLGWIKFRGYRVPPTNKIQSITVSRLADGWYASIMYRDDNDYAQKKFKYERVGIDLGVVNPVTIVCGKKSSRKGKFLKRRLKKLERQRAKAQKALARKKKGSANRNKARIRVAKLYQTESRTRKDFHHKLTYKLATQCKTIFVEDLVIKGMTRRGGTRKKGLNRSMLNLGLSTFVNFLEYKTKKYGSTLIKVDPKYTSQTCNECGCVSRLNRESQAKFLCIDCGHIENADINAARNVMTFGLRLAA